MPALLTAVISLYDQSPSLLEDRCFSEGEGQGPIGRVDSQVDSLEDQAVCLTQTSCPLLSACSLLSSPNAMLLVGLHTV